MPKEHVRRQDWLADLMRDWTTWMMSVTGYGDSTTLWRAMAGQISAVEGFGSRLPNGVIPPGGVAKIQLAFNALQTSEVGRPVTAFKVFWLAGGSKPGIAKVRELYEISQPGAYKLVDSGSSAMRGYLVALQSR